jgi:Adenovirus endoprotease
MNTTELTQSLLACASTKQYTLGVFPADSLPLKIKKLPAALICNSDPSTLPGTHWLAIYLYMNENKRTAEFFDSFGRPPSHYSQFITQFLQRNAANVIYNKQQVQAPLSLTCGLHCLCFLKLRCKGASMKSIVKKYYTKDLIENDVHVTLNIHVVQCTPDNCTSVQKCIPIIR